MARPALVALLWLLPFIATPAGAQPEVNRVRPTGPVARMLLEDGPAQSPTVARLLEAVGRSDLIVYVATGFLHVPGRLDLACARPGVRFLRITINVPEAEPYLIAALAHELQHAVEIAGAPEVLDAATLARHYREHGQCITGDAYCTKAAQQVTTTVLCEVAAGPSTRR